MGKRGVTLSDVAEKAGVSRTAAAKVLLGTGGDHVRVGKHAARRIRKASAELSYQPNRAAQQLRGANTHMLGVLMDTVNAPIMNDRLAAIEREAYARGYRLLIGQLHGDQEALRAYLADFDSRGVDAVLCLFDVTRGRGERLTPFLGHRRGVVLHGKPLTTNGFCVRVDTGAAIAMLIAHLLSTGRERIGLQLEGMTDELMAIRRNAYTEAMEHNGQTVDPALIWTTRYLQSRPDSDTVDETIKRLHEQAGADAIVACNDIWAARLIQGLKTRGIRVPDDVAVTGYDNLDLATVIEPSLTTIDQQHDRYAAATLDMLTAIAAGTTAKLPREHTVSIPPKLIIRQST